MYQIICFIKKIKKINKLIKLKIHKLLFWNNKKEAFYFTIFTCTIIALCIVKKDLQQLHFGCVQPLFLQHLVEIRKKNFYISYLAFF